MCVPKRSTRAYLYTEEYNGVPAMYEQESTHSRKNQERPWRIIDWRPLHMQGLPQNIRGEDCKRVTEKKRIEENTALVRKLIRKFPPNMREELFQEGLIGLMIAARKYDPDMGVRFGTYATYWIMQRIRESLRKNRAIYFPHHVWQRKVKIDDARYKLGENATPETIARCLRMPLREVKEIIECENVSTLDDGPDTRGIEVASETSTPEDQAIENTRDHSVIMKLMLLDPRSRDIIMRHYGILGPEETLTQIAKSYKFSRERIRQIRNKALEFLKYKW